MAITGDFARMSKLIAQLERAARGEAFKAVGRAFAHELQHQVARGIDQARAPSGAAWKPRIQGGKALATLGDRAIVKFTGNVIRATIAFKWAGVHQHGATIYPKTERTASHWHGKNKRLKHDASRTTNRGGVLAFSIGGSKVFARKVTIPARPMLPNEGADMPPRWVFAVRDVVDEVIFVWLGGG